MTEPIWTFQGEFRFLSNFYIEPDGTHVEGEFQSMKHADPSRRKPFLGGPADAKRFGRKIPLRLDWEQVKLDIMYRLVLRKFSDHPDLASWLWRTRPKLLEEGNTWGDTFWGICEGVGENHLGKILMQVREECIPF